MRREAINEKFWQQILILIDDINLSEQFCK